MQRSVVLRLSFVALLAIAVSGCLFDSDPEPVIPPPPLLPYPGTEDQAIANFKTAYTGMELDDYRSVLSPQYVFILRPEDVPTGENGRFTCAEELAVAANMFSGLPIDRGGGVVVPAISSIAISVLDRQGTWSDVGASDPDFPNTRRGLYTIQLTFSRVDANTIIVYGQQEFYVASRDSVVDGVNRPYFQLRGQRDLTIGLKSEMTSWGGVKSLYRWNETLNEYEFAADPDENEHEHLHGSELVVADILYLRRGHVEYRAGDIDGSTTGRGLGFRLADIAGFRYDHAEVAQARDLPKVEREGYTLFVDGLAPWRRLR